MNIIKLQERRKLELEHCREITPTQYEETTNCKDKEWR